MQMNLRDKVKFAGIFLKSLWKPTNNLTAEVILSEDGCYHLWINDGTDTPDACMMYA